MPDTDPALSRPPRRALRRLWIFFAILMGIGFVAVNGAAYLAARTMTHYVPNAERPHIHVPMTAWDKTRLFLGTLSLPRPVNHLTPADRRLAFETLHFRGSHGLQLEAWRIPGQEGQPVALLFPGYCGSKDSLLGYAREFHQLGYETWLVDFHGVGGSQGHTTTIGWDEADDVAAACREAARMRPCAPQVLFGTSLGAAAILRAEHLHTVQPAALVLECPYDRLVTTVGKRFSAFGIPAFPLANLLTFWGGAQLGFDGFAMNPVEYARDVRCPTLLLEGDRDVRVGLPNARAIAEALGTHGTFELFKGQAHAFYLSRAPEQWRHSVQGFLAANLPALR
ncbi:MAG: alpha/beta fold hydrolase [Chthoniobacter sp.]|uniref:alpha/beta hydrolase n=1 Tax=Chthoniobacter sp. TaxID=2510640 RepID=UPI0032A9F61F